MASIDKQGKIRFRDKGKKQRVLCPGTKSQNLVSVIKSHVEHLLACREHGLPPEPVTSNWLAKIDDDLYEKLAKLDLVESRKRKAEQTMRLVDWIDTYIEGSGGDEALRDGDGLGFPLSRWHCSFCWRFR